MTRRTEEYDWLNDPFDERKCAEELQRARRGGGKGCALALLVAAILIVFALGAAVVFAVGFIGSDLGI